MQPQRRILNGALWITGYLLVLIVPLLIVHIDPPPHVRGFWTEFSVALGFIALAMLSLQFILTARVKPITSCYGIDIVLQFHRLISLVIVVFVIAHPVIYFIDRPGMLRILNPIHTPWRTWFAYFATAALLGIVIISLFRKALSLDYEIWRILHWILGITIIAFSYAHVGAVGYYVDSPLKQILWGGTALIVLLCLLYTRKIKPVMLAHKPWRISDIREESDRCWTVTLEAIGHQGFEFYPGQLAWLILGQSPYHFEDHPFTMSSSATKTNPLSFTIKELGDYTSRIKDFPINSIAYVDGPYGSFTIDYFPDAKGAVFIAGGIGITPMISMLRTLADRKDERPFLLFYGIQKEEDLAFGEDLKRLEERMNLKVVIVVARPSESWQGATGFVDQKLLDKHLPEDRKELEYFFCGPPPMKKAIDDSLRSLSIPYWKIHSELFELV